MKLKQGDYLPVSEIKTEADFNNVIKAAENCGFDAPFVWELDRILNGVFIANDGCLWMNPSKSLELNQLTLSQWLERGNVKPESKEWDGESELKVGDIVSVFGFSEPHKVILLPDISNDLILTPIDKDYWQRAALEHIKPLKSKADQEREDFIDGLFEISNELHKKYNDEGYPANEFYEVLFDAGYRKVKPLRKEDLLCSPNLRCATTTFGWLRDNGHILVTEGE